MVQFSPVTGPWWDDRPTIIVGCGMSLSGFDLASLHGLGRVLAVKESVWDLPFADACFSLHLPWQKTRYKELCDLAKRMPLYLAVPRNVGKAHFTDIPGAIYLERCRINNGLLLDDPRKIESGGNSGFGALNLSVLKRARLIYLFGFDYVPGAGHYCQGRYTELPNVKNETYWLSWGDNFLQTTGQLARLGITVINASERSTIKAFPKVPRDVAMTELRRLLAARG